MLESVGLDRSKDVYIANVVKCRPPNNRKPTAHEMAACLPFLEQQIEWVQPKIIVLVGGTAAQGVLGTTQGITRLRGQWQSFKGILCMPTFHPSYLLRNDSRAKGSPKYMAWQDLKAVVEKHKTLENQT